MVRQFGTAAAVLLALALMPLSAAADTVATKACNLGRVKAITSDVEVTTTSMTYKNILGARLRFAQGSSSQCVIVHFSAHAQASGLERMRIRAVIDDGAGIAEPKDIVFVRSTISTSAFNFVFTDIPAGSHVVTIQWLSELGNIATLFHRSMIVQFAP